MKTECCSPKDCCPPEWIIHSLLLITLNAGCSELFMLFYCYLINWAQHATAHFNQQSQAATGLFMDILDVKTPEENESKLSTGDCIITSIFIMKKEP
jgi:hypothetical protein